MKKNIYLVGGAVRDKILGLKSKDKDYVAVGYEKEDFSHLKCVGKEFPVFLLPDGNELALARSEKKIANGYHGFTCNTKDIPLNDDLKRRDLTINSIAYDEKEKKYFDPYNGIKDIKNKVLRHTSDAFKEDPVRVLRLARFQAKLGFEWKIGKETIVLVKSMENELNFLTQERVYKEIVKTFEYDNWYLFFICLKKLDVLKIIFPILERGFNENKYEKSLEFNTYKNYFKFAFLYLESKSNTFDIEMSKRELAKSIKFIKNYYSVENFVEISLEEKIIFFLDFKKEEQLFEEFLCFCNLVDLDVDYSIFLKTFKKIDSYSPKYWLEKKNENPSGELIRKHLWTVYSNIISKIFN